MSRVIVAENAGFCPGVRAATVAVEQRMRDRRPGETLAVLGQLIHNETYLRMLESAGVRTVKEEELPALAAGATPDAPVTVFIGHTASPAGQRRPCARLPRNIPDFLLWMRPARS